MSGFACYACHGLGLVQPIDTLAQWLNERTPKGIHFQVVGGTNPQIEELKIRQSIESDLEDGKALIFVGHSMGAMLAYYLGYRAPLIVAIDPTDWGSNIDAPPWTLTPPRPGQWRAPLTVGRFINFHQDSYPGGGVLENPGNGREDHHFPDCNHMSIPTDPRTMRIVLNAVLSVLQ